MNETEEWNKFRQGDREAFNRIYRRFAGVLYSYGSKFTRDTELVEDCIQDLFVELWETRTRLGNTTSVKFYLFRALRRKLARQVAFSKRFTGSFDNHSGLTSQSAEFSLILDQMDAARKQILENTLSQLSARQREILYLKYFDDLTFNQISGIMEIDLKSAYKLMYKALAAIKQKLSAHTTLLQTLSVLAIASCMRAFC